MGLEDYIRARSGQYYPNTKDDRIISPQQQKRTQLNDKFSLGNGFPPSRFMRPLPLPFEQALPPLQQNDLHLGQQQPEKSMFDTDVENVDDSTITVTSVGDTETPKHAHGRGGLFDHDIISQDWDASELSSESGHNKHEDEIAYRRRKSTIPSALDSKIANADEYESRPFDWILQSEAGRRPTSANDNNDKNKRNSVDKPNVSRIPRAKSRMSLQRSDSDPGARPRSQMATEKEAAATNTRTVQLPNRSGAGYRRMSNFPQSLTTTPNNRFNFKSERPYERLIQQQSPTRKVSGPRPQPGRRDSTSPRKTGEARRKLELSSSRLVRGTLDTTDDENIDDDDDDDDDDDEDVDEGKDDDTPKKLDYALNALSSTPSKRQEYLSSMTITEWEDFGDELIGHVGEMLKLIKESRQSRRRTTALFEAEIRRRRDETQRQSADLDEKLDEMKQGGLGVLKGLKGLKPGD